jgi:tight adherence protein B
MLFLIEFLLVMVCSFVVVLYVMRPSAAQAAVDRFLAQMQSAHASHGQQADILKEEILSSSPWLHEGIRHIPGARNLARLIAQAGRKWKVSSVLSFGLGGALVGGYLGSVVSPSPAFPLILALLLFVLPIVVLLVMRAIRFQNFEKFLPDAISLMTRGLRAGHAVSAVLEMVGDECPDPVGTEFRAVHKEQVLGLPLREAMLNLVTRVPSDDLRFLATAIILQKETGGNLVQILEKTGNVVRERARLRGQLRIYTAQGRLTGWILCSAPFALFLLLMLMNPKYESLLLTEHLGQQMVYLGLALMAVGILAIRKVIAVRV